MSYCYKIVSRFYYGNLIHRIVFETLNFEDNVKKRAQAVL